MKTLTCDLCDYAVEGETFEQWMNALKPHYAQAHADVMESKKGTPEEMQAELDKLRAENASLKKTSSKGLSMKVSEKGALSVYGLGRFPVTLYKEQWVKLLGLAEDIKVFIQANDSSLKTKE